MSRYITKYRSIKVIIIHLFIIFAFLTNNLFAQNWKDLYLNSIEEHSKGNLNQAILSMEQAKILVEDLKDDQGINYTIILSYIGQFNLELGKYDEAEKFLLQAYSIRKEKYPNYWEYLATSCENLASLYLKLGQYEKAENFSINAINLHQKNEDIKSSDYIKSINILSLIYRTIGKISKADSLLQMVELDQHSDTRNRINYFCNNAMECLKIDQFDRAIDNYNKALELISSINQYPNYFLDIINNLGYIYKKEHNYIKAESLYVETLNFTSKIFGTKHPKYIQMLNNLSLFYFEIGNMDKAEKYFIELCKSLSFQIDRNFPVLNEYEREKFWTMLKKYLNEFDFFAISRHYSNPKILCEMYDEQIATKGLLLNSIQKEKNRIRGTNDSSLINLYAKIQKLKQEYSNISISSEYINIEYLNQLDSLDALIGTMEHKLSAQAGKSYYELRNPKTNWKDIQLKLKPSEAAIEIIRIQYLNTDTIFYAALIVNKDTKEYPKIVINKNGYSLENVIYSNYIKSITDSFDDQLSYDQFWEKIDENLIGMKKIYLSLDGVYNKINLNTLRDNENRFLIDKYNIILVSNTNEIINRNEVKNHKTKYACLFGNPNYNLSKAKNIELANKYYMRQLDNKDSNQIFSNNNGLKELKGSEIEITEIEKILKDNNWQVDKFIKENAIEEALKSIKNPFILHIATHGGFSNIKENLNNEFYRENYPLLNSVLYFAGANRNLFSKNNLDIDDGILTALEATNLCLDSTEIVVLSACETAKGKIVNGEGVYGLQRAFQIAGAKTIIMSLWKVDDKITQKLMVQFYKNWIVNNDKFEAFKSAQLEIKSKFPNPYDWGSFIIVGI